MGGTTEIVIVIRASLLDSTGASSLSSRFLPVGKVGNHVFFSCFPNTWISTDEKKDVSFLVPVSPAN